MIYHLQETPILNPVMSQYQCCIRNVSSHSNVETPDRRTAKAWNSCRKNPDLAAGSFRTWTFLVFHNLSRLWFILWTRWNWWNKTSDAIKTKMRKLGYKPGEILWSRVITHLESSSIKDLAFFPQYRSSWVLPNRKTVQIQKQKQSLDHSLLNFGPHTEIHSKIAPLESLGQCWNV